HDPRPPPDGGRWYPIYFARTRPTNPARIPVVANAAWYDCAQPQSRAASPRNPARAMRSAGSHRLPDVERRRRAAEGDPDRVGDSVGDGGEQRDGAGLAAAFHADRIGGAAGAGERQVEAGK